MNLVDKIKELIAIKEEGGEEMYLTRDYKSGLTILAREMMDHVLYDEVDDSWYEPMTEALLLIRRKYLTDDYETAMDVAFIMNGFLCEDCKMMVYAFAGVNKEAKEFFLSELVELIEDAYPDEVDADDDLRDIEW